MKIQFVLIGLVTLMSLPNVWGQSVFQDLHSIRRVDLTKQIKQVDDFVYMGPRPRKVTETVNDYQFLADLGVVTDLDLEGMPWDTHSEKKDAPRNGLDFVDVHITPSPLRPSERAVTKAVGILLQNSAEGKKSYVHCDLGRDRTALVIAEYQIQMGEKSPQEAWSDMVSNGYNPHKGLIVGIVHYFAAHHPEVDLDNSGLEAGDNRQ